jgi:hypothetical protein
LPDPVVTRAFGPVAFEARVEAVLTGVHAQHEDVAFTREIDHRDSLGSWTGIG